VLSDDMPPSRPSPSIRRCRLGSAQRTNRSAQPPLRESMWMSGHVAAYSTTCPHPGLLPRYGVVGWAPPNDSFGRHSRPCASRCGCQGMLRLTRRHAPIPAFSSMRGRRLGCAQRIESVGTAAPTRVGEIAAPAWRARDDGFFKAGCRAIKKAGP
jgi:hypothetical protein